VLLEAVPAFYPCGPRTLDNEAVSVLLERDAELDRLSGLVRRAGEGQGSVVVIEGPPGIGKTRLGQEAAALARGAGVPVISASGSELEQEFGFGVVRQLFEPVLANADEGRFGECSRARLVWLRRRWGWRATRLRRKDRTLVFRWFTVSTG
jgi:AAA ATPase domain